jgi:phage terminase small subunit
MAKLSAKHQQFINEYLTCWNATEAYRRVYDCSYEAANANGSKLLVNASIADELQRRIDENAMSANEVLALLASHARGDIDDYLSEDGFFDLKKARAAKRTKLIRKFKTRTTTRTMGKAKETTVETEFELYDAQAAATLLGKHHKLFTEKTEITGKDGGAMQIGQSATVTVYMPENNRD